MAIFKRKSRRSSSYNKTKAPAKSPYARSGSRSNTSGRRKTPSPRSSRSYQPERTSVRTAEQPGILPFLGSISPERKVDIIGAVIALVGLLTIFSLFSANNGGLSGAWVQGLTDLLGWGVYLLPVGLVVVGVWLVARHVERLPALNVERIVGIIMLFIGLLAVFQWVGNGGGYFGQGIFVLLKNAIGVPSTVITLIAWTLIALALTLDLSMQEMFQWTVPLARRLKVRLGEKNTSREEETAGTRDQSSAGNPSLENDNFTPIRRVKVISPGAAQSVPAGVTIQTNQPVTPVMSWVLPRVSEILEPAQAPKINEDYNKRRGELIIKTLADFGAPSELVEVRRGPAVTMFGVRPLFVESRGGQTRVRVGKISSLADDLALALAASRIRIEAPVPGHDYVGIEVPNDEMTLVALREVVESEVFTRTKSTLRFGLGKDVGGHPKVANLDAMPHLLIAGTTGSGKSVCVNSILSCFLLHNTPDELRLILVDPKRVELTGYNGIPHLLEPVVVEIERVVDALQRMTREMDNRYHKFAENGSRNIQDYNARMEIKKGQKLPHLVIIIDELADLMMIAPDETERTITRLAQLARATGIHMVLATQRPSVDVVTGLIKANFPARIAFAVASNTDSRVILDQPGAERLLGRGDMLFQAPDAAAPVRLQGVFVSDLEITRLVEFWRNQSGTQGSLYAAAGTTGMVDTLAVSGVPLKQVPMFDMEPEVKEDTLMMEAIDICRREGRGSVSMLQRKLRIGYTRAARLVDTLEVKGILGSPDQGTGVRPVLDYGPAAPPKED